VSVVSVALPAFPVIDGHNDLAWAARQAADYSVEGLDGVGGPSVFQTDLARLHRGGVRGQFWSVYVPVELTGGEAVRATLEQIDFVHRLIARYPGDLALARTADDVRAAWSSGRIASLLGAEGGHSIGDSLPVLRMFARLGVRYMTLTHNDNTAWADSATDVAVHGGLSKTGRAVVAEMNRIGVIVDLSHVAETTMNDALDTTTAPVIFSHSSCRALCAHPRNVPDDVLARLSSNGGVVMVAFVPPFLSDDYAGWLAGGRTGAKPVVTIGDLVRHIEHARDVAGIDHVGLGGDYDGFDDFPAGLEDVSSYALLRSALRERRWSDAELDKLAGLNVLRVIGDTERPVPGIAE
jgi:membrane dipeptidase